MTTLTLRYIKGDFVVTGSDIRATPVQDAPRGKGLVRGALAGLAHQRDRSDLQAPRAERRAVKRGPAEQYGAICGPELSYCDKSLEPH